MDYHDQKHDRFQSWRESDDIGYVMLAFAVIIEAIKDLFSGDTKLYEDVCAFWHNKPIIDGETKEKYYPTLWTWLDTLGMDDIPEIISDEINDRYNYKTNSEFKIKVDEYIKSLEHLYGLMKIDYFGVFDNE